MKKPEIIATIGNTCNHCNDNFFEELIKIGIKYFRFNLSKCDDVFSLKKRIEWIQEIYEKSKEDIKIMLDLPFPGRKPRMNLQQNKENIQVNEILFITSNITKYLDRKYKTIFVDVDEFGKKVVDRKPVIYSDGECSFDIVEIVDDHTILVKANENQTIYNKKSLTFGYVEKKFSIEDRYLSIIKSVNAQSIALSFVTSDEEVLRFKQYFPDQDIVSKIECAEGIAQIDKISQVSDIMLGRGDLCLTSDYHNLFNFQKKVSKSCNKNKSSLYIATGILNSLNINSRPSQADIIDVSNLLLLSPDYLILNFPVVENNCELAIKTISNIYNSLVF